MTTETKTATFTHTDYPFGGSGARKLADSAVAPLVAAARGYELVVDKDGTKELAARSRSTSPLKIQRQLNTLIAGDEDILVMPWYAMSAVATEGTAARMHSTQYRPSRPFVDAEGKSRKYGWFAGQRLVLDLHPATPVEWLDSSLSVLLTEGLIKGDSALTALLIDAGVSLDVLSQSPDMAEARRILRDVMLDVPKSRRVPVINSASVTTWEDQNDQWRHIRLTDKRLIVAFDGDLAENRMVWKQTQKAFRWAADRKARAVILALGGPEVAVAQLEAGMDPADKVGIDDYLSKLGTWGDLMSLQTDALPPEPEPVVQEAPVGSYRVHPDIIGLLQRYTQETNADGSLKPARWQNVARIGGRVLSTAAVRQPTWDEIHRGALDTELDTVGTVDEVTMEIATVHPDADLDDLQDGDITIHTVTGNASLLMSTPQGWVRALERGEARIPGELLRHPDWPLSGRDWDGLLSAIKRRGEEMQGLPSRRWDTMGWVPAPGDTPAFIVGRQVLAASDEVAESIVTGVTERTRKGSTRFGLAEFRLDDTDEVKAQVRADIRAVVDAYMGLWPEQPSLGALALTAAYRPTVPLRTSTTIAVEGVQGSGKSFFASRILCPWQARPSADWKRLILGTAADTRPETEQALSQMLAWVGDDLAPTTERGKAESQEAAISDIIRAVFNGGTRNRRGEPIPESRALFITTAENALSVPSIRSRAWAVRTSYGMYDEDGIKQFDEVMMSGAMGRLASALVQLWWTTHLGSSWEQRIGDAEGMMSSAIAVMEDTLIKAGNSAGGHVTRQAAKIADLDIVTSSLGSLYGWAGGYQQPNRDEELATLLSAEMGPGSIASLLLSRVEETLVEQETSTPGHGLVAAIAQVLSMGKAHLTSAVSAGSQPTGDAATLSALGWQLRGGEWVAQGPRIGVAGHRDEDGDMTPYVVIDRRAAWSVVQQALPSTILDGVKSDDAWAAAAGAGLVLTGPGGKPQTRVRLTPHLPGASEAEKAAGGECRPSGVGIRLSTLLSA